MRFPAVKVYERGVERRDLIYMMQVNNRTPTFIGDLRAQIGAAQLGGASPGWHRRTARHRRREGRRGSRHLLRRRRFREEVSAWPDGEYESDVYVDHDPKGNQDVHVHCKVTVRGDALTVDFRGLRRASRAPGVVDLRQHARLRRGPAGLDDGSSIPKNEGFFDSIELIAPEGCCLNPRPGRSVAAGTHHPGVEVGEAIALALARVIPERACPQIYKAGMPAIIYGVTPTGKVFVDHSVDSTAAYCGAVHGQDGWGRRTRRSET